MSSGVLSAQDVVDGKMGDFPLDRLSHVYGIAFEPYEREIIQIIHRYFWLRFRKEIDRVPAEFAGTPLELWGLIMIYSCCEREAIVRTATFLDVLVPLHWRDEFEASSNWSWPLSCNIEGILLKICEPRVDMTGLFANYSLYFDFPTPQNIMNTIRDFSSVTDHKYALFPVTHDQVKYAGFTEGEKKNIQLCYTLLQWKQLLTADHHMIPICAEGLPMEIWLIQFMVYHSYTLKTSNTFQPYEFILPLAYYKYFPKDCTVVDNNDNDTADISPSDGPRLWKAKNRAINEFVKGVQRDVMRKMSKTGRNEFMRHKEMMWAMTMARSSRSESKIGVLSPELSHLVQQHSWDEYYARPR
jgi:hypothetical protein